MKRRRIIRKRRVLAVGAMFALALAALSGGASANAAGKSSPETTSQPNTGPSLSGGPSVERKTTDVWAGYVATGGGKPFTYVAATFQVAAVNCGVTPHLSWTSQWVGLDGWNGKTVEQIGVRSECGGDPNDPPNAAHYYAWWEMYKVNDPDESPHEIEPVNAGDTIEALVYQIDPGSPDDALEYVLSLYDLTKGGVPKTYSEPCPEGFVCKDASAEVISEGYNEPPWKGPADFGQESFYDISVGVEYGDLIGNFATTAWTNIAADQEQKNSHGHLVEDAVPTELSDMGAAFSVVWRSDE